MSCLNSASIQMRRVSRQFAGAAKAVLSRIDLRVEPGEFLAVLGPSGCGKSTLLRLLAKLDQPQEGEIFVDNCGHDFFLSYVFQDPHLLPWRNVLQNVALPLELIGIEPEESLRSATLALEWVGLKESLLLKPAQLSGGMRMRVSLARALVTKPTLLLLDEPFGALDELTRMNLQEQLADISARMKMTTVFVTHSVGEAAFLANRAIVMSADPSGHIHSEVSIGYPEFERVSGRRTARLRDTDEYFEMCRALSQQLRSASPSGPRSQF